MKKRLENDLSKVIDDVRGKISGLNVTVPFKS